MIPAHEIWLHQNLVALTAVLSGIEQARAGEFVAAPDIEADVAEFDDDDDS